ncbi:MAG: tryptophan--tRNA ligase [Bacteroidetes bacterium]|nr:tryptophan--tRNA ligase [Rhodothermia bacterium]MCS7155033.1 tryptophan--tRNA ligase [Bacteroidota bacterium]MCX7907317.1 tryptophan--tRNA ligase [Bacteroidota bacterium]MDW8137956.1 tryptophan--tRNA ligase [Bacteroidota bacterium]MDW8286192.1 tryptophan--tRNA ligase [Bacteroidota bacterium]
MRTATDHVQELVPHLPKGRVILSGIQPSGRLHIGNYFGAIRQHLAFQYENRAFYFIANYHALTSMQDRALLERYTLDVALDYLALGLDPERATFFLQSDVPQVTELAWIFSCLVPVSLLEKGVSYKDKIAKGLSPVAGLLTYPVLQAADILIYGAELVPVGQDQKQHLEFARDIAQKFNHLYGELLKLPEPYIHPDVAVVPGIDGQKMSKSYGNTIEIFASGPALRKRIMSIVTDSTPLEAPKDPDTCTVFALLKLFATPEELAEIRKAYLRGGYGYGQAKERLYTLMEHYFAEARERRLYWEAHLDEVRDILREGGRRAREVAEELMERVRQATGLLTTYSSVFATRNEP